MEGWRGGVIPNKHPGPRCGQPTGIQPLCKDRVQPQGRITAGGYLTRDESRTSAGHLPERKQSDF